MYLPKTSDNREVRTDYYATQRSQNQRSAGAKQQLLLEKMCGVELPEAPEQFEELKYLLNDLRVSIFPTWCLVRSGVPAAVPR